MITFGTIKEINRTKKENYVLFTTPGDREFICSAKNIDGLSVGNYVAVGAHDTGTLLKNAVLMLYTPGINHPSEPQYKPLWSR